MTTQYLWILIGIYLLTAPFTVFVMTYSLRTSLAVTLMLLLLASFQAAWAQTKPPSTPVPPVALRSSESLTALAPAELMAYGNQWTYKGRGSLRFFGFKAYDATLWLAGADKQFSFTRPFALEIRYDTAVKGKDISNTSLIELQRISQSSPEQITAWASLMDSIFVDVQRGDQLIGLHLPGVGVKFLLNGKPAGESPDLAFSEAFFKIWLDPKTKRPDLRVALLGANTDK